MRIGIGKKVGDELLFEINIPFLAPCIVALQRVENPGERSPHWHVYHEGEKCGALWRRIPGGGGEAFLSGHIESPLFPGGKLEIAVFASKESGSQKDMVWRPRMESEKPRPESRPASSDSTGSTPSPEYDDDIPF